MTMLAHSLKNILQLVPEAMPFVKQASIDQEFPLDSRDSALATALQVKYFEKVAYHPVDPFQLEKISKAVELYGIKDDVKQLSDKMIKVAKYQESKSAIGNEEAYRIKEASFTSDLTNIKDRSVAATELYKQAQELGIEPSEDVIRYSGHGFLNKEAAVQGMYVRFTETNDKDFVKVARVIVESQNDERLKDAANLVKLANFIDDLDKKNHLQFKGFDIYKEAFFTKEAGFKSALMVKLAGKDVPYENLERVGHTRIASYIGKDIADEFDRGPENFKAVAETLPLDLQRVLVSLTKNV